MIKDNVLIIGASNALMKRGWSSGFNNSINKSFGASCSGAAIISLLENEIENPFIIFENSISDQDHLTRGVISESNLELYLHAVYSKISQGNAISLLMPTIFGLRDSESLKSRDLHKRIATHYGVDYFDVYEVLKILSDKGVFTESLFKDHGHLLSEVAVFIGKYLNGFIQSKQCNETKVNHSKVIMDGFKYHSLPELLPERIITTGTSLIKKDSVILNDGDSIDICSHGYLQGLFIDASNTNATIKLESSSGSVVKEINVEDYNNKKGLFRYINLSKPLRVCGKLRVTVDSRMTKTESTLGERPTNKGMQCAYICGLLISDSFSHIELEHGKLKNTFVENIAKKSESVYLECANGIYDAINLSRSLTSKLLDNIPAPSQLSPDFLRELSLYQELVGDLSNSKRSIDEAMKMRPGGPLIKLIRARLNE